MFGSRLENVVGNSTTLIKMTQKHSEVLDEKLEGSTIAACTSYLKGHEIGKPYIHFSVLDIRYNQKIFFVS